MPRCSLTVYLAFVCAALWVRPLLGQAELTTEDAPATFQSRVNLVVFPVVVRYAQWHAIGTLRKEDFALFDKGKPQTISRFSLEKSGSAAQPDNQQGNQPAGETAIPAETGNAIPKRFVAYVFDDLNITNGDLLVVQKAALAHLATALGPTDRAAIYTTSGQNNLDFTDNKPKLRDAVSRLRSHPMYAETPNDCPDMNYYMADQIINKNNQQISDVATQDTLACAGMNSSETAQATQQVHAAAQRMLPLGEQGTRITLGALRDIVRRLSAVPGQRTLVFVSPGFLTITPDSLDDINALLDRAGHASILISALDARGLYTPSEFDVSKRGSASPRMQILESELSRQVDSAQADVLGELADGTGGTFFQNSNDLTGGLNRIASAPEYVYLLGFSPQNPKADGSFHHLKVTIQNGKGLALQARRGYYAAKRTTNAEDPGKAEIEEAVFSREELHDLPVDLHTQFFKPDPADAKLTVLARIDLKHLRFKKQDGRNRNNLTVVAVVFDRDGNYVAGTRKTIDMKLRDQTLQNLTTGLTIRNILISSPALI